MAAGGKEVFPLLQQASIGLSTPASFRTLKFRGCAADTNKRFLAPEKPECCSSGQVLHPMAGLCSTCSRQRHSIVFIGVAAPGFRAAIGVSMSPDRQSI
jgi:hypothetical protein